MTRWIRHCVFLSMVPVVLASSAQSAPRMVFEKVNIDPKAYRPAVEEFLFIIDASQSMRRSSMKQPKVDVATALARAMVGSIPELDYEAGVRSFGQGPCLPDEETSLLAGVRRFSRRDALQALDEVRCAGDESPLDRALHEATRDLQGARGKAAVIVLSDGLQMGEEEISAARRLNRATGACIYAIQIGRHRDGEARLRQIVQAAGCGSVTAAEQLADSSALRQFIIGALLSSDQDSDGDGILDSKDRCPDTERGVRVDTNGCPLDSDRDGVADGKDRCPETPAGVAVDDRGCPRDSDGDGVTDDKDRCPDTPRGTPVDSRGCPVDEAWQAPGEVLFATGSAELRENAKRVLHDIAAFLKRKSEVRLSIEGHADKRGAAAMNMTLSQRRAESTKAYLVGQGIAAARLTTRGFGESMPVVPNDSPEHFAMNRRVEFKPLN